MNFAVSCGGTGGHMFPGLAVAAVHFLDEFGATEACWSLEVEDLPALVGMDATGRSLYDEVASSSRAALNALLAGKASAP